jgi:hypothetical protein
MPCGVRKPNTFLVVRLLCRVSGHHRHGVRIAERRLERDQPFSGIPVASS